jgi:hypothetical protein
MTGLRILKRPLAWIAGIRLPALAAIYVVAYLAIEILVEDPIRYYNFCVLLSLSGIYFSWFLGGRRAMIYVAFFNVFFVFIFSKLLWNQGIIIYGPGLFLGRSFLSMYVLALVLLGVVFLKKSPADERVEQQEQAITRARQHQERLEFMVASRKLKQDLVAQANQVKDELQLLEGAWQSKIHDIINELPAVKEREIYQQILLPYQENIIRHLRDLELSLTFDPEPVALAELGVFLAQKFQAILRPGAYGPLITVDERNWLESSRRVVVDRNKVWDMLLNVCRNSQAALDLKHIERLRLGQHDRFQARLSVIFAQAADGATVRVVDNGGGVTAALAEALYREPVPSRKRRGEGFGQGTLFVKFFAERMGIVVSASNTHELGEEGLAVQFKIFVDMESDRSQA